MTNSSSSNKDKEFPIPQEIRDYYKIESVCVIGKLKRFIKIKKNHIQFLNLTLTEFKKKILKPMLDELEEAKNLSEDEKKDIIEFRSKMEDF